MWFVDKDKTVNILGVPFNALTWKESLHVFEALLKSGHQFQIAKANPEFVMTAQEDNEDLEILNKTAMNLPDGVGILWAATFLSLPPRGFVGTCWQFIKTSFWTLLIPDRIHQILPERVGGVEHVLDELTIAAKHNISVFLMGASEQSREGASTYIKKHISNIRIAGHMGSFAPLDDAQKLVEAVNKTDAGFLIVCFGHPAQEKWIYKNLKKMPNIRIADGEGGTFDYMAKIQKRAPKNIQKINLEWLWRLVTQKKRFKKIWTSVPKFMRAVFKTKLVQSHQIKKNPRQ